MGSKTVWTVAGCCLLVGSAAAQGSLQLDRLAKLGTVDSRYQGYNIEMAEITGGRFWSPYGDPNGGMFRQRPPIDLTNPRLIALARALGPSLMRVSGTWANSTYVPAPGETPARPPEGFSQILTRDQWRAAMAFSRAVDAQVVTSFAVSAGTRDAGGVWTSVQAQRFVDLTQAVGGTLYAAEFFNEPNLPALSTAVSKDYDVADYVADFRVFEAWARRAIPDTRLLGTGGVTEGTLTELPPEVLRGGKLLPSKSLLEGNPGRLDGVSYHFYGDRSQRCGGPSSLDAARVEALTATWLDRTLMAYEHFADLRDRYEPGKPIWNTETAQAACGGSPWASTFLDSFRYLNQLGVLARKGVQAVLHNTLAASDYALIDGETMTPRPNYWAALLWHRLMGRTVLASPDSPSTDLRLFAHCLPQGRGGVGLLALNTGPDAQRLEPGGRGHSWTMSGQPLETRQVLINGKSPELDARGRFSGLEGAPLSGVLSVPARSISFVSVPDADNPACR
ncbi:MAG: hypothetical protein RLZZ200_1809 [Pseudomonadota bacterium]